MQPFALKSMNTPQQIAEYLDVPVASLAQARYLGTGIPFVRVGRLIRYRREDVEAYIVANTHTRTDQVISA